jgi:hypothetical protein
MSYIDYAVASGAVLVASAVVSASAPVVASAPSSMISSSSSSSSSLPSVIILSAFPRSKSVAGSTTVVAVPYQRSFDSLITLASPYLIALVTHLSTKNALRASMSLFDFPASGSMISSST